MTDAISLIGDFSIFGYTKNFEGSLKRRINDKLGILPRTISLGNAWEFFLHTTYGDMGETNDAIAIKLGFLRSVDKCPMTAQSLLATRLVGPGFIHSNEICGNGLIICLGKSDAKFAAFKTLLGVPQLYYAQLDEGIICSDRLKCIVQLLDRVELNEDIIPMHYLFRSTPGDLTYYRQIKRLLPGEFLYWADGKLSFKLVQDFRFTDNPAVVSRGEEKTLESLYDSLQYAVGDYVTQVEQKGESLANLLSGGVDSSLLQHLIDMRSNQPVSRSYSFAVRVPSFSYEIEYAHQASQLFHTEHTFVDIQPEDFPNLITRTIEALAQPPILETEPGMLSVAEFAGKNRLTARYYFSGQGADAIFGMQWSKKLKALHMASQIPGSAWFLKAAGSMLKPFNRLSQMALKGGDMLARSKEADAFLSPTNSVVVFADPGFLRQCFGDDILKSALRYRREFAAKYLDTEHFLEKVHLIDLVTETYEVVIQRHQLFLALKREQIHPFFDDDVLRAAFAIPPDRRYIKGLRPKYLLKEILQQKTGAAVSHKPKGFSIWETDLLSWMASGSLKPMVHEITRPGFLGRADFDNLLKHPTYFLWELLIFDLFQRSLQATIKREG